MAGLASAIRKCWSVQGTRAWPRLLGVAVSLLVLTPGSQAAHAQTPEVIGEVLVSGGANSVAVGIDTVIVTDGGGVARVIAVPDPASAALVAVLATTGNALDVAITPDGNTSWVGDDSGSLYPFDTSDPANPVPGSPVPIGGNPLDLHYDEGSDRLIAAIAPGTLEIFDNAVVGLTNRVSVPLPSPAVALDTTLSGNVLYLLDQAGVLRALDVTIPASTFEIDSVDASGTGTPIDLAVSPVDPTTVYVLRDEPGTAQNTLSVVDFGGATPTITTTIFTGSTATPRDLSPALGTVLIVTEGQIMTVSDVVSNGANQPIPFLTFSLPASEELRVTAVSTTFVGSYVATSSGVAILNHAPADVVARASVQDLTGTQAGSASGQATTDATGRSVAFNSTANNLTGPGVDTNSERDVFAAYEIEAPPQRTFRANTTPAGQQGTGTLFQGAIDPAISADGVLVTFASDQNGLDPAVPNDSPRQIYRKDLLNTGALEVISRNASGAPANADAVQPDITASGADIVFATPATNLTAIVPSGGFSNVYGAFGTAPGALRLITESTAGGDGGNGDSTEPVISADGSTVAIRSAATNLIDPPPLSVSDQIFTYNVSTHAWLLASVAPDGSPGNGTSSEPSLNADGTVVAFTSSASNLVPDDTNFRVDVFVRDFVNGVTERISRGFDGSEADSGSTSPSISDNGRWVAFNSVATNLVPGDTNGDPDVFVFDRLTGLTVRLNVSADRDEAVGNGFTPQFPSISGDGRRVAFESDATNLVPTDTNARRDIFLARNGLAFWPPPPAPEPVITWVQPPPLLALGGEPIPLTWNLADFDGAITENQAHFGLFGVLGSSPVQPGTNGPHSHTFFAPNVGTFDSPVTYAFVARALNDGAQVLSPALGTEVSAGSSPPTVEWVIPPPFSAISPSQFTVRWRLNSYVDPADTNELAIGDTTILAEMCNQPGGNGEYECVVNIPVGAPPGGVTFNLAAFAQNPIEFGFATIQPVLITPP